jgi:UDP-N-acetylglucosamine:LPS N-acetylglucosamine transferase
LPRKPTALTLWSLILRLGTSVVAWLLRIPLVVHEQNSIPGTTNKILSKIATQTFQIFATQANSTDAVEFDIVLGHKRVFHAAF